MSFDLILLIPSEKKKSLILVSLAKTKLFHKLTLSEFILGVLTKKINNSPKDERKKAHFFHSTTTL